jgi:4-amino-4-deoxy-L-arabinose transferase-like glycosyltransferase
MAEMLSALLMFCAVLCIARFMDSGAARAAVGFGIFAGLAIMTKGTGLALGLMPLLAIIFTGRFELLKNSRLWMAALITVVIAGPWTWHFRNQGRGGWEEPNPSLHFTEKAIFFYGRQLAVAGGWMVSVLAIAGALTLLTPAGRRCSGTAAAAALVLAIWLFQAITPVGLEARHLAPAMPALIFLAVAGLHRITADVGGRAWLRPVAYGLMLLFFFGMPLIIPAAAPAPGYGSLGNGIAWSPFRIAKKDWHGFEAISGAALAAHCRHMLVASDARGEGMFIAEVAMRDPHRPSFVVVRASKMLASSTWSGGDYQAYYDTPAQVVAAMSKFGVEAVAIDSSPARIPPHQRLLQHALSNPNSGYRLVRTGPVVRDSKVSPAGSALFIAAAH